MVLAPFYPLMFYTFPKKDEFVKSLIYKVS
jgi:hypothetical protein